MDKKKKIRVVVVIPVIVTLLVLGGVVTLVLIAGSRNVVPGSVSTAQLETEAGVEAGVPGEAGGTPGFTGDGVPQEAIGPSCAFDFLIGLESSAAVENIRSLGRPYRVLAPGAMVTQDYSAERINLTVDENDIVQSVDCG